MSHIWTFNSTMCNTSSLPLDGVILPGMHTAAYLLPTASVNKEEKGNDTQCKVTFYWVCTKQNSLPFKS